MANQSPTSPLPGVTRGRAAPIGSLNSITIHSPVGSLSSVNANGIFSSGHFKATPQGQRRRWCDYTPTEVWPATPSPAGDGAIHHFGVPAVPAATSPTGTSYAAPPTQLPVQAHATNIQAPMPVTMGLPGMLPMPVTAGRMYVTRSHVRLGAAPANLPEGAQMLFMQVGRRHEACCAA